MSAAILSWSLGGAQFCLAAAMLCTLFRAVRGPRAQDRILALDACYVNGMLLMVAVGIRAGTAIYFEIALAIALLGFIATAAFAKFLMRGEVIE